MIYLSGGLTLRVARCLGRRDFGIMLNPANGDDAALGQLPWAFENGCYRGTPQRWLARLPRLLPYRATCLFTPLPDVLADPVATWERWHQYRERVADLGFPLAYVSQDGETRWPADARCLFIGGSTDWKLSEQSYALARRAKAAGLWVHMGRVNSLRRMRAAHISGIDSVDGTHALFLQRQRLPQLLRWLDQLNTQKFMEVS